MKLFGYGSLMNASSLQKTAPSATIVGPTILKGYKRVFDLASSRRINKETGIRACVLNIKQDSHFETHGVLIDFPERCLDELVKREEWYDLCEVVMNNSALVQTFVAHDYEPYSYVYNDPVQDEYMDTCLQAAKQHGFLDNFLDTTFIENKPLREMYSKLISSSSEQH